MPTTDGFPAFQMEHKGVLQRMLESLNLEPCSRARVPC